MHKLILPSVISRPHLTEGGSLYWYFGPEGGPKFKGGLKFYDTGASTANEVFLNACNGKLTFLPVDEIVIGESWMYLYTAYYLRSS